MKKRQWARRITEYKALARAGGRRRYNAARRQKMWERRFQILRAASIQSNLPRGSQKKLAHHFGVDKGVISRDLAWVRMVLTEHSPGGVPKCYLWRGRAIIEWEVFCVG